MRATAAIQLIRAYDKFEPDQFQQSKIDLRLIHTGL